MGIDPKLPNQGRAQGRLTGGAGRRQYAEKLGKTFRGAESLGGEEFHRPSAQEYPGEKAMPSQKNRP
jgi:hypothetical protein